MAGASPGGAKLAVSSAPAATASQPADNGSVAAARMTGPYGISPSTALRRPIGARPSGSRNSAARSSHPRRRVFFLREAGPVAERPMILHRPVALPIKS
jgi:hypothetical protein